jgi:uncharacterized protein YqgV (UPF0045/DUF77 family)
MHFVRGPFAFRYHVDVENVRVEYTVEPFKEGAPGPHVFAALESLRSAGFEPELGPFGTVVEGLVEPLFEALSRAALAAFAAGADAISVDARLAKPANEEVENFLVAVRPVVFALGARLIDPEDLTPEDVPLHWKGQLVAGVQPPVADTPRIRLDELVRQVEVELGGRLAELSRVDKQRAVRALDERGFFSLRNAVEQVADSMGVSRVTVYSYLNAHRAST